jgi:glycine/D-amino acid oxidase-like deaminating enzyme
MVIMSAKMLIYGAGVIGSVYAVRFAHAGFDVTVMARGDRLNAIRSGGLRTRHVHAACSACPWKLLPITTTGAGFGERARSDNAPMICGARTVTNARS